MKISFLSLLICGMFLTTFKSNAAAKSPMITCEGANGSGFTGILERGAHYDLICEVTYWSVNLPRQVSLEDRCPGSLYSSEPHFVASFDINRFGRIDVNKGPNGEQIYIDENGSSKATCSIENDFPQRPVLK